MPEIQFIIVLEIVLGDIQQFGVYERVGEKFRPTAHVAQGGGDGYITAVVMEV